MESNEAGSWRDRYLSAQLAGDRRAALSLLDEALTAGVSPETLVLSVIREAQGEIGRLWQENRISIAQEHLATAVSQLALAHVFQRATPKPKNGKKVVVACVEGELHDFPARLAADLLDLAGYEVRFLGASVPTEALISMLESEGPHLLALSVTMSFHLPALKGALREIREALPSLPIAVGGHATRWADKLGPELNVPIYGADGASISEEIGALLGVRKRQGAR